MKLKLVTMTGADESCTPEQLLALTRKYPFVEWAILLSRSSEGKRSRFPSRQWIGDLIALAADNHDLKLAGHLCGAWVRDLVIKGKATWLTDRPEYRWAFDRIQINFHGEYHKPHDDFFSVLQDLKKQYILQMDGHNEPTLAQCLARDIDAVPLFDKSGGIGQLPDSWPKAYPDLFNGYAGGLGPDSLEAELPKIAEAAGESTVWIDMETRIRSEDDKVFVLQKVERCLEIASKWVS